MGKSGRCGERLHAEGRAAIGARDLHELHELPNLRDEPICNLDPISGMCRYVIWAQSLTCTSCPIAKSPASFPKPSLGSAEKRSPATVFHFASAFTELAVTPSFFPLNACRHGRTPTALISTHQHAHGTH